MTMTNGLRSQPLEQFQSAPEICVDSVSQPVTKFQSQFVDCMEMYTDAATVAHYLDHHEVWFRRCALPMVAEPLGKTGYVIVIGRFGSMGFEIEPKIGLNLLPQDGGVYRIETLPVPDYTPMGYDVDFRAAMELVEHPFTAADGDFEGVANLPSQITRVQWQLDLTVSIHFPKFIQALPTSLVQGTGDQLLRQIVRQISRRLMHKVQEDFHGSNQLPMPKQHRKWFF
jgi:Protein of unknown function (DUF1997)